MKHSANVVAIKQLSRPAASLLSLARALADFMAEDTTYPSIEELPYEERLQVTRTIMAMVKARKEELA
jgi:hypothetical protein